MRPSGAFASTRNLPFSTSPVPEEAPQVFPLSIRCYCRPGASRIHETVFRGRLRRKEHRSGTSDWRLSWLSPIPSRLPFGGRPRARPVLLNRGRCPLRSQICGPVDLSGHKLLYRTVGTDGLAIEIIKRRPEESGWMTQSGIGNAPRHSNVEVRKTGTTTCETPKRKRTEPTRGLTCLSVRLGSIVAS